MNTAVYEDVGLELHELLARLEPASWTDARRPELSRRIAELRQRLEQLEPSDDSAMEAVRERLEQLASVLAAVPSEDAVEERWMEFRTALHPRYQAFAESLRACHVELPSLRPTNYTRSFFHAFFGVVAILFVELVPWFWVVVTILSVTAWAWTAEAVRRFSPKANELLMRLFAPVAHPHERYRVNSSTWYATALTVLATTGSQTACVCAVAALGFGDPAAALVGRKFGRIELVNNRSLEGTMTFAFVAFAAILTVLWIWHPALWPTAALVVAGAAAITAAIAELFSRRLDDNFTIPLFGGAAAFAVLSVIG